MPFRFHAALTALALIASMAAAPAEAAGNKVVLANGDWEPHQGADLPGGGPATRVVTAAFESQGWTVEYRYLPWERGKTQAARGNIDGTFLYSKTDERAKSFVYSDPVIALQNVIFHHKDNPVDWSEPADLAGLTFGGVIGYDYDILRENPDVDVEVDRIGKPELNFKKLAKGRVDAVISNERVGRQLAARAGVADEIAVHPKPTKSEHYYLMISKAVPNHREIIDVFNAGLKALAENGRRDELLASASGES